MTRDSFLQANDADNIINQEQACDTNIVTESELNTNYANALDKLQEYQETQHNITVQQLQSTLKEQGYTLKAKAPAKSPMRKFMRHLCPYVWVKNFIQLFQSSTDDDKNIYITR